MKICKHNNIPPCPECDAEVALKVQQARREAWEAGREALREARAFVVGCGQESWSTTAADIGACLSRIDAALRALPLPESALLTKAAPPGCPTCGWPLVYGDGVAYCGRPAPVETREENK